MTSATTPQRTGDGVIKYYRCSNHVQKLDACPNGMHANEKKLEAYLLATLDRKLQEYAHALACQQASQTDHAEEIRRLQGRLARLKELYIDGDVSKDDYQARSTLLKNEIAALDVVPEMPEVPVLCLEFPNRTSFSWCCCSGSDCGSHCLYTDCQEEEKTVNKAPGYRTLVSGSFYLFS